MSCWVRSAWLAVTFSIYVRYFVPLTAGMSNLVSIALIAVLSAVTLVNQNNAAGAITLLMAGFSASGIFGMDGVCTKLK